MTPCDHPAEYQYTAAAGGWCGKCSTIISPREPGRKDDQQKPRWALLMAWGALEEVMKVLEYGAKKYSPNNWRHVPDGRQRYLDAMLRHAIAYARGEKNDAESGFSHLAHMMCCALYLLSWDLEGA